MEHFDVSIVGAGLSGIVSSLVCRWSVPRRRSPLSRAARRWAVPGTCFATQAPIRSRYVHTRIPLPPLACSEAIADGPAILDNTAKRRRNTTSIRSTAKPPREFEPNGPSPIQLDRRRTSAKTSQDNGPPGPTDVPTEAETTRITCGSSICGPAITLRCWFTPNGRDSKNTKER